MNNLFEMPSYEITFANWTLQVYRVKLKGDAHDELGPINPSHPKAEWWSNGLIVMHFFSGAWENCQMY